MVRLLSRLGTEEAQARPRCVWREVGGAGVYLEIKPTRGAEG